MAYCGTGLPFRLNRIYKSLSFVKAFAFYLISVFGSLFINSLML